MNILQAIKRGLKTTDKLLMSLCLLTSLFGVLMVYSATYSSLEDGSLISRTALVMLLAVIVGVAMCIVISFIDYEIVLRFWMIIGGVCLLMMLLLFPFGSGHQLPAVRAFQNSIYNNIRRSSRLCRRGYKQA